MCIIGKWLSFCCNIGGQLGIYVLVILEKNIYILYIIIPQLFKPKLKVINSKTGKDDDHIA